MLIFRTVASPQQPIQAKALVAPFGARNTVVLVDSHHRVTFHSPAVVRQPLPVNHSIKPRDGNPVRWTYGKCSFR